ncbi:MAG: hypothetical protein MZW92_75695 [Comamonadaceae bacterium]|nr:hypothetical protein [Comamonadaceae bacterium]
MRAAEPSSCRATASTCWKRAATISRRCCQAIDGGAARDLSRNLHLRRTTTPAVASPAP